MRIAFFGGTFNPCHLEHQNLANACIDRLNMDKLIIIPTNIPPHKQNSEILEFSFRNEMAKLAFFNAERVEVDDYEGRVDGVSYTYSTMNYMKSKYPHDELFFLMGADMLKDFVTWKNPHEILNIATLIVARRSGERIDDAIFQYRKIFEKDLLFLDYEGSNLSSTKIRIYNMLNLEIDTFLDKRVYLYIINNNLYSPNDLYAFVNKKLKAERRRHTAGVILTALSLASRLGVDKKKAEISALLHDVAKYENAKDYGFIPPNNVTKPVVHAFLGAHIAKQILGINDPEILDAIAFHSTGKPAMSRLSQIIFVSDLIEEGRDYKDVDLIRQAVFEDFDSGFLLALKSLNEYLLNSVSDYCQLTNDCYTYYKNIKNKGRILCNQTN